MSITESHNSAELALSALGAELAQARLVLTVLMASERADWAADARALALAQ